jgi:hypothetical protein
MVFSKGGSVMKRLLFLLLVVFAGTVAASSLSSASAGSRSSPIVLTFTKSAVGGSTYVGTIDGGGTIEVMVLDRKNTAEAQYFNALFRVDVGANPGDRWFGALLRGSFDFTTGQTHLKGEVKYGNWLQGAQVVEQGLLQGTGPLTFTGSLTLKPNQD